MMVICLFTMNSFSHSTIEQDRDFDNRLLDHYFDLIKAESLTEIESFFTADFNDGLKSYFLKRCGLMCQLNFSDSWKEEYSSFVRRTNASKQRFTVVLYDLQVKDNGVYLTLGKQTCEGERSQEVVVFVKSQLGWLINKVEFSSWSEVMLNEFGDSRKEKFRKLCAGRPPL